jgi:hypothetical protein
MIFGKIDFKLNNLMKNVKQKDHEIIDLDFQPTSFYSLPNDTLVIFGYETKDRDMTKYLRIYDIEFKLIKKIYTINNKTFSPRFLTSNDKNSIFITDIFDTHQIIKTDIHFNFVKQFGSTGSTNHQLDCPYGISFYKNSIFVCDENNHRIQKFSEDLVFEKSYPLKFNPMLIQITNNVAAVQPHRTVYSNFLLIINLDPFLLIKRIESLDGPITAFNSWIYIYQISEQSIHCFNINGDLVEKKDFNLRKDAISNFSRHFSLCGFNKHLIIGINMTNKLIIL